MITAENTLIDKAVRHVVHPHDLAFFSREISKFPRGMANVIAGRYCNKHGKSRRDANMFLLLTAEKASAAAVSLAASDSELIDFANAKALRYRRFMLERFTPQQMAEEVEREGYALPQGPEVTEAGTVARFLDPLWWRRAIRKKQGREVEAVAIDLGLVQKKRGTPYSSNDTVTRRKSQKIRNRRMLEELLAVNELGDEFTLAELSDLSVSNPVIRRGELMTRIAGFEALANELGYVAEFYTITTPSRFHRMHSGGQENEKYDGSTPRDAQVYLAKVWARCRSALCRLGIRPFGFRVAEPHHDGTPHWHTLVFVDRDHVEKLREIIRRYAINDTPGEPGAYKHRFKAESIDPKRGSAAGYIAKYIAKNIDGFGLENEQQAELFDNNPQATAERVDAWASTWGIRQFQQIGGPPVSVWRELRRIEGEECGVLEEARDAADSGDWAGFCKAMGGVDVGRGRHPIRITRMQEINTETGELPLNRYSEPAAGRVVGVEVGNVIHVTRWHEWRVEDGNKIQNRGADHAGVNDRGATAGEGGGWGGFANHEQHHGDHRLFTRQGARAGGRALFSDNLERRELLSEGEAEASWSSVNNCTGVGGEREVDRGSTGDSQGRKSQRFRRVCGGVGGGSDRWSNKGGGASLRRNNQEEAGGDTENSLLRTGSKRGDQFAG